MSLPPFITAEEFAPAGNKQGRENIVQLGHTKQVNSVTFSPDGKYALSGSVDRTLILWDVATGRVVRIFFGTKDRVASIAISPDGRYALSGDEYVINNLKLWDMASGRMIRTFSGHEEIEGTICVAISPDGKYALSGGNKALKLWDMTTGRELRTFSGNTHRVSSIAISPDGKYVVSGNRDYIFTTDPDGRQIFEKSRDNTIRMWDIATGKQIKAFNMGAGWVTALAMSPDGKYVISGDFEDDSARIWDIASGKQIKAFSMDGVSAIAISPDGKYALLGGVRNIKLCDIAAGKEIKTFSGLEGRVHSVAFSPDGKYALSGDDGNVPKLWDIASGKVLRAFGEYAQQAATGTKNPDGKKPSPDMVTEEARRYMARGQAAIAIAKSPEGYEAAIQEFWEAAQLAPHWADPFYNLGLALEKAGKFKWAVASLNKFLQLAPDDPHAAMVKEKIYKFEHKAEPILTVPKTTVPEMTVPEIVVALVSFAHTDQGWRCSGSCPWTDLLSEIRRTSEGLVRVLTRREYNSMAPIQTRPGVSDTFMNLAITKPFLKYIAKIDQCERTNPCPVAIVIEIEVVSKTLVKVRLDASGQAGGLDKSSCSLEYRKK